MKYDVMLVAGARPNFIKVAPVRRALCRRLAVAPTVVHTGQHYGDEMSGSFFRLLDIPPADVNLNVGSGSHGRQTARIMERFEALLEERRPDCVVVFGDVNSTAACALVATKAHVPTVHVEAGLRSHDREMPEEINRLVADAISDLLLTSEPIGRRNLLAEGHPDSRIRETGNVMIDTLEWIRSRAEQITPWTAYGLREKEYGLVTLHRPSNVDDPEVLAGILEALSTIGRELPLLFPAHPRTRLKLQELGWRGSAGVTPIESVDYLESVALQRGAALVLTDSGGIQEETTHLDVPCLTLRNTTERPVTTELGTATLVGTEPRAICAAFERFRNGDRKKAKKVPLWDGRAAERAAEFIEKWLSEVKERD